MGTFLLGTFCALALVSAPKENPKDTVDVFVIDGKKMEHFDGNCLKNKFIFDYSMSCQDKGKHVERIHEINTNSRHYADSVRYRFELVAKQLREMNDSLKGQMIYYWNNSDCIDKIKNFFPSDISSIRIDTASVYIQEGELKKIKVIDMTMKPEKSDNDPVIYIIDGKKSTEKDLHNLDPTTIKSINIDKGMTTTISVELKSRKTGKKQ